VSGTTGWHIHGGVYRDDVCCTHGWDGAKPEKRAVIPCDPIEAREKIARYLAMLDPDDDWPTNAELGGGPTGTRDDEFKAAHYENADEILALLAALTTQEPT
jgi:hypothetical protein